jgi:hypothetical protein
MPKSPSLSASQRILIYSRTRDWSLLRTGRIAQRSGKSGQPPASSRASAGQSVRVRLCIRPAIQRLTETPSFRAAALARRCETSSR